VRLVGMTFLFHWPKVFHDFLTDSVFARCCCPLLASNVICSVFSIGIWIPLDILITDDESPRFWLTTFTRAVPDCQVYDKQGKSAIWSISFPLWSWQEGFHFFKAEWLARWTTIRTDIRIVYTR
jgi:hypothetical protein